LPLSPLFPACLEDSGPSNGAHLMGCCSIGSTTLNSFPLSSFTPAPSYLACTAGSIMASNACCRKRAACSDIEKFKPPTINVPEEAEPPTELLLLFPLLTPYCMIAFADCFNCLLPPSACKTHRVLPPNTNKTRCILPPNTYDTLSLRSFSTPTTLSSKAWVMHWWPTTWSPPSSIPTATEPRIRATASVTRVETLVHRVEVWTAEGTLPASMA
jgi:hypothetical protein